MSMESRDEERLEELRELNRQTFKETGSYLSDVSQHRHTTWRIADLDRQKQAVNNSLRLSTACMPKHRTRHCRAHDP